MFRWGNNISYFYLPSGMGGIYPGRGGCFISYEVQHLRCFISLDSRMCPVLYSLGVLVWFFCTHCSGNLNRFYPPPFICVVFGCFFVRGIFPVSHFVLNACASFFSAHIVVLIPRRSLMACPWHFLVSWPSWVSLLSFQLL